jgi:hypothetical protein
MLTDAPTYDLWTDAPTYDLWTLRVLHRPPLDQSAGVRLVKRKVESSIQQGRIVTLLDGACSKGWLGYGRHKEDEIISI